MQKTGQVFLLLALPILPPTFRREVFSKQFKSCRGVFKRLADRTQPCTGNAGSQNGVTLYVLR